MLGAGAKHAGTAEADQDLRLGLDQEHSPMTAPQLPVQLCHPGSGAAVHRPHASVALRLLDLGSEPVPMMYHQVVLSNPWWRLYVVDRPGLVLESGGERQDYPVDGIMVIPGWCRYRFLATPGVWHGYIHFEVPAICSSIVARRRYPRPYVIWDRPDLLEALRVLSRDLTSNPVDSVILHRAAAIAHEALAHSIERMALVDGDAKPLGDGRRIEAAQAHIGRHLDRPIAVEILARILGVGRDHTIRLFREATGLTPLQYILEQRIIRAASLLTEGETSIDEIARLCGFAERGHLTRAFRQRMGVAPAGYRRLHTRPQGSTPGISVMPVRV